MLGSALFTTVTSGSSMKTALQTTPSVHHLLTLPEVMVSTPSLSHRGPGRSLGLGLRHGHDATAQRDHQRGAQCPPGDEDEDRAGDPRAVEEERCPRQVYAGARW